MKDNFLLKVVGVVTACLLTLMLYIVQDTRTEVSAIRNDFVIMKVDIATIQAKLGIEKK